MAQLQAGYFLESIRKLFSDEKQQKKTDALIKQLSYFELEIHAKITGETDKKMSPVIAVADNIILRGLPTNASLFIEEVFSVIFRKTRKEISDSQRINYSLFNEKTKQEIFKSLHIIDPRYSEKEDFKWLEPTWEKLIGGFEEDILYSYIPTYIGEQFVQLFEYQKPFDTVLRFARNCENDLCRYFDESLPPFMAQPIDFTLEIPYNEESKKGLAIEVDGRLHDTVTQRQLDNLREYALNKAGWEKTLRIRTHETNHSEFKNALSRLKELVRDEYFTIISENFDNPLYKFEDGLNALQLSLSPLAIARIHKTIITCISSGLLNLQSRKWKIGIIERDVPCGFLAIEDLKNLLENLFELEGANRQLPEIDLSIFITKEFRNTKLNKNYKADIEIIGEQTEKEHFDLLIDIAILQRKGTVNTPHILEAEVVAEIRSCHSISSMRHINTNSVINYRNIIEEPIGVIPSVNQALLYFLQNIFRRKGFLPGQIEVINKFLQHRSVYGNLPASGGKIIASQLASLLQPGINISVFSSKQKIVSQSEILEQTGIDSTREFQRNHKIHRDSCNQNLFNLVLPEIFHCKWFREHLGELYFSSTCYSSLIVHDAYCISEWSQDFRASYFDLYNNIQKFCKSPVQRNIPIIALSSTASYNVLFDILKQFRINNDAIISTGLVFNTSVEFNIRKTNVAAINTKTNYDIARNLVVGKKNAVISQYVKDLFTADKNSNALILCPEEFISNDTRRKNERGLADKLRQNNNTLTIEAHADVSDEPFTQNEEKRRLNIVDDFVNQRTNIFITTTTYGTGIDKPDLQNIISYIIPPSIETLLQLSGKAGRDIKKAQYCILYNNQVVTLPLESGKIASAGKDKGNKALLEKTIVDKQIIWDRYDKELPGIKKEKAIINELLNQVELPVEKYEKILQDIVEEEFDAKIRIGYSNPVSKNTITITEGKETLGSIDFNSDSVTVSNSLDEKLFAGKILNFIKEEIRKQKPKADKNVVKWLNSESLQSTAGIKAVLPNVAFGESRSITIGFQNNAIRKIEILLHDYFPGIFTKQFIADIAKSFSEAEDFVHELDEFENVIAQNDAKLIYELKRLFYSVRYKNDTLRALYRFRIIGLIDDYAIDLNDSEITLKISRKAPEDYRICLYEYLSTQLAEEQAKQIVEATHAENEGEVINNCIDSLLNFIYYEIVPSRYNAVNTVIDVCENASEARNPRDRDKIITEYASYHIKAKYANKIIAPNLIFDTANFTGFGFTVIEKYIETVGYSIHNWYHLKNSCEILLEQRPYNYVFLILHAYSLFLLHYDDEKLLNRAFNDAVLGFRNYKEEERPGNDLYTEKIDLFLIHIYQQNAKLRHIIEPLIFFKIHSAWMRRFNEKFLEEYGR